MTEPLDSLNRVPEKEERHLLSGPADLLHSAAYTFAQTPIDGITQAVGKIRNEKIEPFQLVPKVKEQNLWTAAGNIAGTVGHFVVATKTLRGALSAGGLVAKAAPMGALESGTAGALVELVKPVSETETNYPWAKFRDAGIAFGTFGVMTKTTNYLTAADVVRQHGRRTLAESIGIHGFSGVVGGATNAELEALGHGKLMPAWGTLFTRMGEYGAFGAAFGAVDFKLNRANVNLRPNEQTPKPERVPTTEEYILKGGYEKDAPMAFPLLTWIAENRPHLRPPRWTELRQEMVNSAPTKMKHLDLSAWPVEQRKEVLAEIRKLASGTQFGKDANIDAFISRMNFPELQAYSAPELAAARTQAYGRWTDASGRLEVLQQNNPKLQDLTWEQIIKDTKLHQEVPSLKPLIDEVFAAEAAYLNLVKTQVAQTGVQSGLERTLNEIAQESGLPKLKGVQVNTDKPSYGDYLDHRIGISERILNTGRSVDTVEVAWHEMVHFEKRPGFLRGLVGEAPPEGNPAGDAIRIALELERLAKPGGTYDLLMRLADEKSLIARTTLPHWRLQGEARSYVDLAKKGEVYPATWDEAAINKVLREMLQSKLQSSRLESYNRYLNYVGSYNELPAWSTGFLTRMRARALGLRDDNIWTQHLSMQDPISLPKDAH